ncbi:MAG: DUF4054 domain-containing protein [Elusimicrobiota bacterium]|jgi:hypothetical protein|nr:DUF4054 domain-containing protein [Elusimicrobiota bacterium]
MEYPITIDEFKEHFDRDFPFAPEYKPNDMDYIRDKDISKAFSEANLLFNPALFSDVEEKKLCFQYLAAHYLVIDIKNSSQGLSSGMQGFLGSKSVGSVSASYQFPQWLMSNPVFSALSQTGYGAKYLTLVQSRLIGNIGVIRGGTLP